MTGSEPDVAMAGQAENARIARCHGVGGVAVVDDQQAVLSRKPRQFQGDLTAADDTKDVVWLVVADDDADGNLRISDDIQVAPQGSGAETGDQPFGPVVAAPEDGQPAAPAVRRRSTSARAMK